MKSWVVVSFCLLVATPALASTIRVEWEGFTTEHHHRYEPGCSPSCSSTTEQIMLAVHGVFELDLDQFNPSNPNWDPHPGGGWYWGGDPDVSWQIAFDEPATPEQIEDLSWYATVGGNCAEECTLAWAGGTTDSLYFDGDADPDVALLDLGPDGTGTWSTGFGYNIQFGGSFDGVVSSSTISIIPEPSTGLLVAIGLVGLASRRRLRRNL